MNMRNTGVSDKIENTLDKIPELKKSLEKTNNRLNKENFVINGRINDLECYLKKVDKDLNRLYLMTLAFMIIVLFIVLVIIFGGVK
jgi:hypothetical protein